MTGKELKDILEKKAGVKQVEIARRLEMSHQNFNALFITRDVKSGTLERICQAIGRDMSLFYPIEPEPTAHASGDHSTAVAGSGNQVNAGALIDEIAAQRKLTETAMDQNSRLLGIIEQLSGR